MRMRIVSFQRAAGIGLFFLFIALGANIVPPPLAIVVALMVWVIWGRQ